MKGLWLKRGEILAILDRRAGLFPVHITFKFGPITEAEGPEKRRIISGFGSVYRLLQYLVNIMGGIGDVSVITHARDYTDNIHQCRRRNFVKLRLI